MKKIILTVFFFSALAGAQNDQVKFSAEMVSQIPLKLSFKAPAGHHFNQEAPAKVELQNEKQNVVGMINKSLGVMSVDFADLKNKLAKDCSVQAQLYVCNDANTYCLPIRQNYACASLISNKSVKK